MPDSLCSEIYVWNHLYFIQEVSRIRLREMAWLSQGYTAGMWHSQESSLRPVTPEVFSGHHWAAGMPPTPNLDGSITTSGTFLLRNRAMKQMQSSAGQVWDWSPLKLPGIRYFKACSACQRYRLSKGGHTGHPLLPEAQGTWVHGSSKPSVFQK